MQLISVCSLSVNFDFHSGSAFHKMRAKTTACAKPTFCDVTKGSHPPRQVCLKKYKRVSLLAGSELRTSILAGGSKQRAKYAVSRKWTAFKWHFKNEIVCSAIVEWTRTRTLKTNKHLLKQTSLASLCRQVNKWCSNYRFKKKKKTSKNRTWRTELQSAAADECACLLLPAAFLLTRKIRPQK